MTDRDTDRLLGPKRRYRRIALWSLVFVFSLALVMPLTGYLYVGLQDAQAQNDTGNPRARFWRSVREGKSGYTAVRGPEASVLMFDAQGWHQYRNSIVAKYGGWMLLLVIPTVLLYFSFRGEIPIHEGRSGVVVKRWKTYERILHWMVAIMFMIQAATGLSILFGRAILIPLLGHRGFAAWADIATGLHNNIGPLFSVAVAIMIAILFRRNIPTAIDLKWCARGGGLFDNQHPDGEFINGGGKLWFWIICTVGIVSIASGYILDFPNWGINRSNLQVANLVHSVSGMLWIVFWLGHAYIGTIGSEGSLEAMTSGYVDENWAGQHHNLWLAELKNELAQPESEGNDDPAVVTERPA